MYIPYLRHGTYADRLQAVRGVFRNSAVVLAELLRGATRRAEVRLVEAMARSVAVLTPSRGDWTASGRILGRLGRLRRFDPARLRDLHFDVLVALTARAAAGVVITADREDFEAIRTVLGFDLEVW